MPQQVNLKPVNTFNKGLITEATVMTFPEGASSDELNCDLLKNGARQRRRSIQFEDNFQKSSFTVNDGDFVHTETWENVSGIGGKEFLVVQVNDKVYFYDKSPAVTSAAEKSFSIDLTDYDVGNSFAVNETPINCSSITGYLVIVSAAIDPIVVQYFPSSDTISVEPITIKIRDFEYLGMSSNIVSVARTSNVVSITTNTDHELSTSDVVQIDCSLGEFNGTFTVTGTPTSTRFTYSLTGPDLSTTTASGFVKETVWDSTTQNFPTRTTRNYRYDLYNMGWAERGVFGNRNNMYTFWRSNNNGLNRSDYPPRNKPWWVGRITVSNYFDFNQFQNVKQGSTLAPNGRYILDFFNQNRSSATSGEPPGSISGLTTIVETARFNATEAYAGRIWYAGLNSAKNGGKIFFSKVIESKQDLGFCYQKADPTAEDTEGLIDSDGGYLIIPDASNIVALFNTGSVLYVLASNGVWIIGGVDQVFKATEYYVSKLSNFGILNSGTLVNVSGTPIYWSNTGIYAIASEMDKPSVQEISQPIKTFYDSISNAVKSKASSVFDRLNNRVYWLYSSEDETILSKNNKILVLDMTLQAYFPWEIEDTDGSTPYILDAFYTAGLGSEATDFFIVAGSDQVIDSNSDDVIETVEAPSNAQTEVKFLVKTADDKLTFAEIKGRDFLDWGSADYSSYAETGYDFYGSATLKKNTPYITAYLKRTEENFVVSGGGYEADYPSGCILTTKWDLSGDSSRWSTPSQVYRILNYPTVNPNDLTFNYPYDTIVTRTKIRGKGRVMRMKFESETGKDFYLIGWEIVSGTNPRY